MAGRYADQLHHHAYPYRSSEPAEEDAGRRHLRAAPEEGSQQARARDRKARKVSWRHQGNEGVPGRTVHC